VTNPSQDLPERYSPRLRTAVVMGGTGTSGAYHAGALRALHESGVKIDVLAACGIGITDAVARCLDLWPARTVHVECDRIDQMVEAITAGATAVLLDNMTSAEVRSCVAEARRLAVDGHRCLLEVSGGVTLETIAELSATGVDQISVGRITNSAAVLDIGLDIG